MLEAGHRPPLGSIQRAGTEISWGRYECAGHLVIAAAIVATVGPFDITTFAIARHSEGTYVLDRGAEYELAQAYFKTQLNNSYQYRFRPRDRIRIRYRDGVVVEFRLADAAICVLGKCSWEITIPMQFQKVVSSLTEPASFELDPSAYCGTGTTTVTIQTGFWGQSASVDSIGNVTITASWIDTGPVTISTRLVQCA
jgi:hypothetical protein